MLVFEPWARISWDARESTDEFNLKIEPELWKMKFRVCHSSDLNRINFDFSPFSRLKWQLWCCLTEISCPTLTYKRFEMCGAVSTSGQCMVPCVRVCNVHLCIVEVDLIWNYCIKLFIESITHTRFAPLLYHLYRPFHSIFFSCVVFTALFSFSFHIFHSFGINFIVSSSYTFKLVL